jgi:hypothetical protein
MLAQDVALQDYTKLVPLSLLGSFLTFPSGGTRPVSTKHPVQRLEKLLLLTFLPVPRRITV